MSVSATERRLQEIVAKKLKVAPADVPTDRALLELDLDSLDVIRAIGEIEEAFPPVRIPMDAEGITTLAELAEYVDAELLRASA